MATAELPKPGVEVIQEFRTTSPTIAAPRLVPCIVGVCRQILEIQNSDGTTNTDAAVSAPAVANADVAETYTINGTTLSLSIDGGPTQTKTLAAAAGPLSASATATAINAAGFVGVSAYVWVDNIGANRLQLQTDAKGSTRSIKVVGGTSLSQFGWADAVGYTWYGTGTYIQDAIFLPKESFPDPRGIIDDLVIDADSTAAYLDLGTELRELTTESAFLYGDYGNGSIIIINDGDGDSLTPFIELEAVHPVTGGPAALVNFFESPSGASITGGDIVSAPVRVHNLVLGIQVNGGGLQTIKFIGKPIVSTDAGAWTYPHNSVLALTVNGVAVSVTIAAAADLAAVVTAVNAATQTAVGYDVAYDANSDGTAWTAGTHHLGLWVGADPTDLLDNTEVVVTGDTGTHANEMFTLLSLPVYQSNNNVTLTGVVESIQAQINNAMNQTIAVVSGTDLVLGLGTSGTESKIEIHPTPTSSSVLLTSLGLTAGSYCGNPFRVRIGDSVYADGALLGNVVEIHPGGNQGRLKLGTEVSTLSTWSSWYIIANNLEDISPSWGVTVPTPDFYIDTAGDAHFKHDFLRDSRGAPIGTTNVGLFLTYEAVRKDVTAAATTGDPALLIFEDVDELEAAIGPIQPSNPLAYGMFIAMQNAANTQISGIGVSDASDDEPYGTLVAYNEAFDFLETEEVYAVAIMTDSELVHQAAKAHAVAMSQPAMKGERVAICVERRPTRKSDVIAVSGTNGERVSTLPSPEIFDTKNPLLSMALQSAGIDPTAIVVADGVYLDIEEDSYRWNITGSVTGGTQLTINKVFTPGQNDDNFYVETEVFPDVDNETYSVKIRGAAIPSTTAGKADEVDTYVNRGQGFATRRVWYLVADGAYASVDGVVSLVDGFYLAAAKAGMVAGNLPSAPMTNFAINGFTKVVGTNDRYTETQLNQIAYGGCDIIIQPGMGAPLVSRHQLTTDMTSIETREQSIVKAVDFCAKFIRTGLRNFIGKYNITETFLDTLAAVVQGQLRYLSDNGVIAGADMNNIIQDTTNPDTVLVDVTLEVLYPCNYIRVTLII